MILKVVLNLYVFVEMVLKQQIISFDTSLALMFKDNPLALFILLLVKPKSRFPLLSVTSVMGIVLSKKRFNASCFCARTMPKQKIMKSKLWIGTRKLEESELSSIFLLVYNLKMIGLKNILTQKTKSKQRKHRRGRHKKNKTMKPDYLIRINFGAEKICRMPQNGKNRQIKFIQNLFFFMQRQIKSMAKKIFF